MRSLRPILAVIAALAAGFITAGVNAEPAITHSFLATGAETRIIDGSGDVVWSYPHASREGWVLASGNILLVLSGKPGSVVEVTRDQKVVLEYRGAQDEIDTVQRLPNGNTLLTEGGQRPRLLELDPSGKIIKEMPLKTQLENTHLQQRMSRKLASGNYLVPHALERKVKEYTPAGEVIWEVATPHWPFTAIRLKDGNTLIGCTHGHQVIEVNAAGDTVWRVTNEDLPGRPIKDCCGVQRLPNGNTVISSYAAGPGEPRLIEFTRDKKIVWTYTDNRPHGIHHFQILDTNGTPVAGVPLR